jgi:hypothetical protein
MPKVFVIQDTGKNLSPAREFGEIEILIHGHGQPDPRVQDSLKKKLRDFEFGDRLLLIGNPILIGIAMHVVLSKHGVVHCLVWDRDHYRYNQEKVES